MRRIKKSILLMTLCASLAFGTIGCSFGKNNNNLDNDSKKEEMVSSVAPSSLPESETIEPSPELESSPEVTVLPEAEEKQIAEFYQFEDTDENNLAALIYLGYGNEEKEDKLDSLVKQFGLSKDLFEEVVINENCEWYAVFPKYIGTIVKVDSMVMTEEGELTLDAECLETEKPVLICCNVSDIIPSSQVTVTYQEQKVQWNPFISLEDGSVAKQENVYTATWE